MQSVAVLEGLDLPGPAHTGRRHRPQPFPSTQVRPWWKC
jgi:hypothetical protein